MDDRVAHASQCCQLCCVIVKTCMYSHSGTPANLVPFFLLLVDDSVWNTMGIVWFNCIAMCEK
jgi:hypothetical protein